MELEDFIKKSIVSISSAIESSQSELASKGVVINPELMGSGQGGLHLKADNGRRYVQTLEFDIAVTIEESTASEGGGQLKVWALSAGLSKEDASKNQTVTRLKFTIPIAFSSTKTPDEYITEPNRGKYVHGGA